MGAIQYLSKFLEEGGIPASLILLTGVGMLVLSIERISYLFFRVSFDSRGVLDQIREQVLRRNYTQALQLCNQQPMNPELNVIKAGLMAVENGREAMKSSLSGAALQVSKDCETRIVYLSLIANGATLVGLLGTITGLIKTFAALANADASQKASLLGAGISEAMNSTAAGLIVGICAMFAHTVCVSKTDTIVGKSQKAGLNLISWIEQSERRTKNG
jgi:biopolymer transport protein ExbB/TolQ